MPSPTTIADLRRTLREKFPATRHGIDLAQREESIVSHSLASVFSAEHLKAGSFTECSGTSPGLALVHACLLAHPAAVPDTIPALVLIDANDSFDPASYPPEHCRRVLWARCRNLAESLRACDIILRDPNLPVVLADFTFTSVIELKRVPLSSWYRLRNLAEESGAALVSLTPSPLIPCATRRFDFPTSSNHWHTSRTHLFENTQLTSERAETSVTMA